MKNHTLKIISSLMVVLFIIFFFAGISIISTTETSNSVPINGYSTTIKSCSVNAFKPVTVYAEEVVKEVKVSRRASGCEDYVAGFDSSELEEVEDEDKESIGEYTITAYCPCEICCGDWANNRENGVVYGAYGYKLKEGTSVASPLPKNTKLTIDGVQGEFVVQDTTADWVAERYNDRVIDIYFSTHDEAVEFNKRVAEVYITKEDKQ